MADGAGTTVLVLDDEADVLHLLRLILERRGFRVFATADGREALRLLREELVSVALVDLLLPGMSGRQFLLELERLDPARRPSVLIVSALRPEAVETELGGIGGFTLVSKPFEMDEIQEQVAQAAAARQAQRG